jgi:TPR repeat protein
VAKDAREAARLFAAAALADNLDAQTEFAIMLFNGEGVAKDEAGAGSLFLKAARRGSPIAQNRLARMLAVGRGLPADPVQATKWHLVAKAAGAGDLFLDEFVQKQSADTRARAEKEAKPWLALIAASRS